MFLIVVQDAAADGIEGGGEGGPEYIWPIYIIQYIYEVLLAEKIVGHRYF